MACVGAHEGAPSMRENDMIEAIDARPGVMRVLGPDGPEPDEPRTPPTDAPREVVLHVLPDTTGTSVTIMVRAWRGRIRWEQRQGLIRLRDVSREDFRADGMAALGAVLEEVAGSLIP